MKKQITLIVAIIASGFAAFSQTSDQRKFHATTNTAIDRLIRLSDGSFTMLSPSHIYSVNASGTIVWSKEILPVGGKYFEAESFVRNTDGSYLIAGSFYQKPAPKHVMILAKTDANGNLLWSRQIYDNRISSASTILKTRDGGFALTGYAKELITNTGSYDAFVMKLDGNANIQWTSIIGSDSTTDEGTSITQTSDNGYAVAGRSYINGASDMFVAKLNSSGGLLWSKYFGDGGYDDAVKIIEANDGGLAVFGGHGTVPVFGFTTDYFLVKLQSSGTFQWAKYYGGSDDDYPGGFTQAADGSYIMTGASYSFREDYNSDCYTIKTNANGNLLLSKAQTGWGNVILPNGTGYVIGALDQTDFFYDGLLVKTGNNLTTCNSHDVSTVTTVSTRNVNANFHKTSRTFTVTPLTFTTINSTISNSQICIAASTQVIAESSEKKENDLKISVYPNPVHDKMMLQFSSDQSSQATIRISNIQGNLFLSKDIAVYQGTNKETINTNSLNKGSYFLNITLKNGNKKLIPFVKE